MERSGIDVVVLAGGRASRMGPLCAAVPKALLPVLGTPFSVWQIRELTRATPMLRRVFYSVRSGMEPVFKEIFRHLPIPAYAIPESAPLGTGGAILNIFRQRGTLHLSDPFLVINGDVLFQMHTDALLAEATMSGAAIQGVLVENAARYGMLEVKDGRLVGFREKGGVAALGTVNAGLYAFRHDALEDFPIAPCSFERDMAPRMAASGQCAVVNSQGAFIDIGTPDSYGGAEDFIRHYASRIRPFVERGQRA